MEILAFPDVELLDVTGPLQVFSTANEVCEEEGRARPYRARVLAQVSPVDSTAGLGLVTAPLSKSDAPIDTLIVGGGKGVHAAGEDSRLRQWISARASRARRIVSVCDGAYLLGAAGLLDGKRAVTHWRYCDDLAKRFPKARVETDPIYVKDGAVWTSAGVSAGIDLSLALIEEDLGHDLALAVARDLVVFLKRHGGQAQFSDHLALQRGHPDFSKLHSWIAANLAGDLSIAALASRSGMSERSFVRHYKDRTDGTPARAVERMRVEAARDMLMNKEMPVKAVARVCGFGTEETMRRSFLRQIGTGPQAYRTGFAAGDRNA